MCLFTSARTVAIVFARSAGSEAMYCAGVLTFDGGFMDSSYRVSPSCAQARRLLSVLKVITRREGGGRLWKSRSDFQGAVGRVLGVHGAGSVQGPSKPGSPHGSGLGVFRWVVERTLAWLHRFRRAALRTPRGRTRSFLTLGCALITWRYLMREI